MQALLENLDKQSQSTLKSIKKILVSEFNPLNIYVFGSRASGTSRPESDWDICLVVKSSSLSPIDRQVKALKALDRLNQSIDIFIYTSDEFNEWKREFSSIPEVALNTGHEIL